LDTIDEILKAMIPLSITTDIEKHPWIDLKQVKPLGKITRIGRLPRGCRSGASTVAICIQMPDGTQYMAETTMALFLSASRALKSVEDEMSGSNARN
jgi:hypothetical protein